MRIVAGIGAMLLLSSPAGAQVPLEDADIPDGERSVYSVTLGDEEFTMNTRVDRTTDGREPMYQITMVSPHERVTVTLAQTGMETVTVKTEGYYRNGSFETVTAVEQFGQTSDRIEAVGLFDLMHKLRGYPFPAETAAISFVTGDRASDNFSPLIEYRGTERLSLNSRVLEAHKIELVFSAPRLWRAFNLVPRTFFWYGTGEPRPLLRAETTEVPGSPRWVVELVDYSEW